MRPRHRASFSRLGASWRAGAIATSLALLSPRQAGAGESLSYKFQSWQEDHGRIRVDAHYAFAEVDVGTDTQVKAMGLLDSIAGATPTGETERVAGTGVPLATMRDLRRAAALDLAHQWRRVKVGAGYAYSEESDYVSRAWSLNAAIDFRAKATTLALGYGRNDDVIREPQLGWAGTRAKAVDDWALGLTQVIDRNTIAGLNFSYGETTGFLNDPYKIVSTTRLDLDPGFYYTPPENRPRSKGKRSVLVSLNRNVERLHGALETSYRYYDDSFGVASHTATITWIQEIGTKAFVQPSFRWAHQTAADFYYYDLDRAGVVTTFEPLLGETGTGRAPFYSSDYRLSEMQTIAVGLKLTWKIRAWLWLDAAYDRFSARGLDGATPQSAYSQAHVFTVGLKVFQ